jgi:hypothetical protein
VLFNDNAGWMDGWMDGWTDGWMNMEHWWNDNGREKLKYSQKNLSYCHFFCHKSQMD